MLLKQVQQLLLIAETWNVSGDRRRQKRHLSDHDLPPISPHLTTDVITRTQKASKNKIKPWTRKNKPNKNLETDKRVSGVDNKRKKLNFTDSMHKFLCHQVLYRRLLDNEGFFFCIQKNNHSSS